MPCNLQMSILNLVRLGARLNKGLCNEQLSCCKVTTGVMCSVAQAVQYPSRSQRNGVLLLTELSIQHPNSFMYASEFFDAEKPVGAGTAFRAAEKRYQLHREELFRSK